ncbi:MAG TPA: hypothetical protein VJQ54_08485 [Candidatus Sulfotelmatobacter sp.]|nr:hypothetical protein [Candidatus Sulfotelmatobacter sp.]
MKFRCVPTFLLAFCAFISTSHAWANTSKDEQSPGSEPATITIPGPLHSFLRMAGISQQISPEDVLPLLARNVVTHGYQGWQDKPSSPTEFLVLLSRYVQQAKELTALAGADGVIRVSNCGQAPALLHILGYRFRQGCGTALETANPERAFLTIDAAFPLVDLEEDLHAGKTFTYPFPGSPVPILFRESDWTSIRGIRASTLLEAVLDNPSLARLYLALSQTDPETRLALKRSPGLSRMMAVSAELDFYGTHIAIRSGQVEVPGGPSAAAAWQDLVGASTASPGQFVVRLLSKDQGWLGAYFDALSRTARSRQAYFCEPHRLRIFYQGLRGRDPSPDAYKRIFRPNAGLLLLVTRLRLGPSGEPQIPGNLQLWKEIFRQQGDSKTVRNLAKRSDHWRTPDQLVQALFGATRGETDSGPLQIFLLMSELDAPRSPERRLTPDTIRLLTKNFAQFSDQYLIFSEFPELTNASIVRFVGIADRLDRISDHTLRGNALGIFQSNVGLWQILARQGQIPRRSLNDSWQRVTGPFLKISSSSQLFDAGRKSLEELVETATGKPTLSQDGLLEVLAGPAQSSPEARQIHEDLAKRLRSDLDGQRLVSLDTILALGKQLDAAATAASSEPVAIPLAGELREFEMPRPIFSRGERTEWATGVYNNSHTDLEMRTNLAKLIKSHPSSDRLARARGELAPFLRDTLVGLNYVYYEPPGAQILRYNPLFVRSHDFAGDTLTGLASVWKTPQLLGVGYPAGGGAHMVGSLADLPYVLAETEEDFIAPKNVQALIWKEMVSVLLTDATLSRWWNVSRNELHAVALYQQAGEELLAASGQNERLRNEVITILADRMTPRRLEQIETGLKMGHLPGKLSLVMPADTFYLEAEFRRRYPDDGASSGPAGKELQAMEDQHQAEVSWKRLSRDFGVPHPMLAQSYARELLNVEPFPACEGYGSRLLAESWDSSYLYWGRLADEMGYSPVMLNELVPELTRRMVEEIFASDAEDWPALLRALRQTGDELRQGKIALAVPKNTISQATDSSQTQKTPN